MDIVHRDSLDSTAAEVNAGTGFLLRASMCRCVYLRIEIRNSRLWTSFYTHKALLMQHFHILPGQMLALDTTTRGREHRISVQ
jgi:hypothetical protein